MKVVIRLFSELIRQFPLHFIFLFSFVFLQVLLNTMSVIAVAPITDLLLERLGEDSSKITQYFEKLLISFGSELKLYTVCVFFGGVILGNGLVDVATQYALLRIKYDVLIHMITDTMGQFFRARYLFFSQGNMGKLLNSFQQELNKVGDTFGHIAQLCANLLQALIFLVTPLVLSPKLTLIFIVIAVILGAPLWFLGRKTYNLGKKIQKRPM